MIVEDRAVAGEHAHHLGEALSLPRDIGRMRHAIVVM